MNYKQNYIDFIKSRKNKVRAKNDGNYLETGEIFLSLVEVEKKIQNQSLWLS